MKSFAKLRSSLVLRSLFTVFAGLSGCAGAEDRAQENNLTYEESLKVDSYVSDAEGFDTRSFWIDTGLEVVVFDAQSTDAQAREIILGIVRAAGAKVVASERTAAAIPGVHAYKRAFFVDVAKMIPADQYPAEPTIDLTFRDELKLPTNAGEVWLRELDHAGVSSTQTVGWVPAARALFVGDLVHHGVHAWLEGGIVDGAPKPVKEGVSKADADAIMKQLTDAGAAVELK